MRIHQTFWFTFSVVVVVICIGIIIFVKPKWGIDFTGGSLLEIRNTNQDTAAITALLEEKFSLPSTIQTTQSSSLLIRTAPLTPDQVKNVTTALTTAKLMSGDVLRFESIGPTIGAELTKNAWWAIFIALGLMIVYLAYTFRGANGLVAPWKFGVSAIYALIHDLLFVTACFVLLGKWQGLELDTLFVTAQLAIFGYSVHDTIVIFDRIKREWLMTRSRNLDHIINKSVVDTMMRSLNTSLTILLVLLAMLFFGGPTIRGFILALTLGTIVGTYSSIFVASPCLFMLNRGKR